MNESAGIIQQTNENQYSEAILKLLKKPDKYRDYLLQLMIDNKASDMYLTYGEPPALRIYEQVYRVKQLPPFDDELLTEIAYFLWMNLNEKNLEKT
jgi:Tfp pilus assembly ATPase PilU